MLAIRLGRNQSFTIHEPIDMTLTLRRIESPVSATFQVNLGETDLVLVKGRDHEFEYVPGLWCKLCLLNFLCTLEHDKVNKVVVGIRLPRAVKVTY
jgi:hypothetical protein